MPDDFNLRAELEVLNKPQRIAFAASCCERLLPAYEAFSREDKWGDPRPLREALERVWSSALGERLDEKEARQIASRCEGQIHHLDEPFSSLFTAPAQDAAIAVVRAVECSVSGDAELARDVSDLAVDAFETYVDATEGEGALYDAELVASSPIYQNELACQRVDLSTLADAPRLDRGVVERLREQSRAAGFGAILSSHE
jgi:uncharacterized protein YjaG (DUF416 family)